MGFYLQPVFVGAVLEVGSYDQNGNVSAWWDGGMDTITVVPGR